MAVGHTWGHQLPIDYGTNPFTNSCSTVPNPVADLGRLCRAAWRWRTRIIEFGNKCLAARDLDPEGCLLVRYI